MEDGHAESLSSLVKATDENMAKYHVSEAPRVIASIAQRVSIKEKIELSIAYVSFGICLFPLLISNVSCRSIGKKSMSTPKSIAQLLTTIIEYWRTLLKSAVFRGHTLQECLQVIRKDIVDIWNFDDPGKVSTFRATLGADYVLNGHNSV